MGSLIVLRNVGWFDEDDEYIVGKGMKVILMKMLNISYFF